MDKDCAQADWSSSSEVYSLFYEMAREPRFRTLAAAAFGSVSDAAQEVVMAVALRLAARPKRRELPLRTMVRKTSMWLFGRRFELLIREREAAREAARGASVRDDEEPTSVRGITEEQYKKLIDSVNRALDDMDRMSRDIVRAIDIDPISEESAPTYKDIGASQNTSARKLARVRNNALNELKFTAIRKYKEISNEQ